MWVLAALTMTVGNLIALRQTNIVRLLAYSSVAQAGFMLVPFAAAAVADDIEALHRLAHDDHDNVREASLAPAGPDPRSDQSPHDRCRSRARARGRGLGGECRGSGGGRQASRRARRPSGPVREVRGRRPHRLPGVRRGPRRRRSGRPVVQQHGRSVGCAAIGRISAEAGFVQPVDRELCLLQYT